MSYLHHISSDYIETRTFYFSSFSRVDRTALSEGKTLIHLQGKIKLGKHFTIKLSCVGYPSRGDIGKNIQTALEHNHGVDEAIFMDGFSLEINFL